MLIRVEPGNGKKDRTVMLPKSLLWVFDGPGQSVERTQIVPQTDGAAIGKKAFKRSVGTLPDWNGADKQSSPSWRQGYETTPPVGRVRRDLDEAPALQRLESGRQGGPIHRQ